MSWLLRKLDSLGGAAVAGIVAGAASQGQAFTNAYLQRLGGRLDEARATLARSRAGDILRDASDAVRADLVADLSARVAELESRLSQLLDTAPLWRPFVLAVEFDSAVAAATLEQFSPALPLTLATAVHVSVGLVVGLVAWEICKMPGIPVRHWRRKRRKARRVNRTGGEPASGRDAAAPVASARHRPR